MELVIILGPTGVGKSDYAVRLAEECGSPVISCDSRQIYSELNIGVARPSEQQLSRVRHYFIADHSVRNLYSAGDYERDAIDLLGVLFRSHDRLVMAGGSGMYIDAVCCGLDDFPDIDMGIRTMLNEELRECGPGALASRLKILDPESYGTIDLNNRQRLVRALEVVMSTGVKFSSYKRNVKKERPFSIRKIGLFRQRDELYGMINARVDKMMEAGLLDEVKSVMQYKDLPALNTVGYREFFEAFDKGLPIGAAIEAVKRNSRRYAKKQMTYWRRDKDIEWMDISGSAGL